MERELSEQEKEVRKKVISSEDMNDIINIIKSLKDSGALIDEVMIQ